MLKEIKKFPEVCARLAKEKFEPELDLQGIENIVFAGVGGSGVVADLLLDAIRFRIPAVVSKSFRLPAFANKNTLVVCLSYSGNTLETLKQFQEARKRKCKIFALTSGGKLEKICKKFSVPYEKVKKGLLPRIATPYMLFPLLKVFGKGIKQVALRQKEIEKKAEQLAKLRPEKILVFSSLQSIATYFKNAVNENAKVFVKVFPIPEGMHNEVEVLEEAKDFCNFFFKGLEEGKEVVAAYKFLKELLLNFERPYHEISFPSKHELEHILQLVYFSNLFSFRLALELRKDPIKTPTIAAYKHQQKSSLNFLDLL